jgi:large subunit ribosomal protein L35
MKKTRKSITKRFKVTKTGKLMRVATNQDHLRGKKTGQKIRETRKWVEVTGPEAKKIKKLI